MMRIIAVHRHSDPRHEFVLLQNQACTPQVLAGHAIAAADALRPGSVGQALHVFQDDVRIPPGQYVLLSTGYGEPGWARCRDGRPVYHAYMNRDASVWERTQSALLILRTQHVFSEPAYVPV